MSATTSVTSAPVSSLEVLGGAYFSYGLFLCFAMAYVSRGWNWLLPALFVMVLVPTLDSLSGEDLTTRQAPPVGSTAAYLMTWAPHGFIIGYVASIALLVTTLSTLSVTEWVSAIFSLGMMGSIAITAAHELIHKTSLRDKAFGRLGLAAVCYMHFEIAHVRGHHVHVGTPRDESTARKGESLYAYICRTVPRCFVLAWRLESMRLAKRQRDVWSTDNDMLQLTALQALFVMALVIAGGWLGLLCFFAQSAIAIFMLEAVSYVEHYGLVRQTLGNGRYGNMTPAHSWDSYHRFSNYLEFNLQRHADHHATPTKSYTELQPIPDASPRLPAGYPVMITLAMLPPLWRRVMDQRLS